MVRCVAPERGPVLEVALNILDCGRFGSLVVEVVGLLIAASARSNLWTLQVGKPHMPPLEFAEVMSERVECCSAIEEAWARYRASGIVEALAEIAALSDRREQQARLDVLRPDRDAAEQALLVDLREALARYERTMEWRPPAAMHS